MFIVRVISYGTKGGVTLIFSAAVLEIGRDHYSNYTTQRQAGAEKQTIRIRDLYFISAAWPRSTSLHLISQFESYIGCSQQ